MTDEQRIADLQSQLAEVTAGYAALYSTATGACWQSGDTEDFCIFCGNQNDGYDSHDELCILVAEHPGRQLLERLEAAEKCVDLLQQWPYTELHKWSRERDSTLAAYDKAEESKP